MDGDSVDVRLARIELMLTTYLSSSSDHETRIRSLESRGTVSGKQMWSGLVGCAGLMAAVGAVVIPFVR